MARLSYDRVNGAPERPVQRDTTFMPMPEHCGRGAQPVFDGVKHVDLVICYFYCTEPNTCKEYQEYSKGLRKQKRMRRATRK